MNDNDDSWQDFCLLYYDHAMSNAKYYLAKFKSAASHWDSRIDEEVVCVDAVMESLQKAFVKYDSSRGASLTTYLSRLVHNELIDELEREIKSLSTLNDITTGQEAEFSISNMVSKIPEKAMDGLKEKLRAAILRLSPIDQSILGFFLEDPTTFVERSVATLGVTPAFVSVHKSRALSKLPSLMNMTADDYFALYEDHTFAGKQSGKMSKSSGGVSANPIYRQFDLETTVRRLFEEVKSFLESAEISAE